MNQLLYILIGFATTAAGISLGVAAAAYLRGDYAAFDGWIDLFQTAAIVAIWAGCYKREKERT